MEICNRQFPEVLSTEDNKSEIQLTHLWKLICILKTAMNILF